MRKGSVKRTTKETDVEVAIDLDGTGASSISTGIGFLDHMLDLLARHSRIDLTIEAKGDLHIDHHHTTEDVGIALGQAVKQALGDMKGITRYADVHVPMDEALTRVALTDKYADMAGVPKSPLDLAGKPLAAGHGLVSGTAGGLFGGAAQRTVGVNPYKDLLGVASKAFNEIEKYALTHDQDDQPQMHQELNDNR